MGLPDIFSQLKGAGLDLSSILPVPDLTRVGLVYVLGDLGKRSNPLSIVTRQVSEDHNPGVGNNTVVYLTAGRRCIHILAWDKTSGTSDGRQAIIPTVDKVQLLNADKTDADTLDVLPPFGPTDDEPLAVTSLYQDGDIASASLPLGADGPFWDNSAWVPRQWPVGIFVPPGFTFVWQAITSNSGVDFSIVWEEWGP